MRQLLLALASATMLAGAAQSATVYPLDRPPARTYPN